MRLPVLLVVFGGLVLAVCSQHTLAEYSQSWCDTTVPRQCYCKTEGTVPNETSCYSSTGSSAI